MHVENRYYIRPGVIEVEQVHTSMLGNHNSRSDGQGLTVEAVKKINTKRAAKQLRRIIDANFEPGDLYITWTYKKGTNKSIAELEADLNKLLRLIKYRYRKRGHPLKWIAVVGVNAPHIHMILNNMDQYNYSKEFRKIWHGHIKMESLYIEDGRYMQLAEYLVKHKAENEKKLGVSLKHKQAYKKSRNLIIPKKRRKIINEKEIIKAPRVPTGYMLDTNIQMVSGISDYTGYRYRYFYLLKKIRKRE